MARFKRITTPWGFADQVEDVAPGVKFASTPSHGGYFLTADRQARMPEYFRDKDANTAAGWYEEDCHGAFVALVFEDVASPARRDAARKVVACFYPDLLERFEAERRPRVDLTEAGEQLVAPGCERQVRRTGQQLNLWD